MDTKKVLDKLNDLIKLDVDAIHAYDQATAACSVVEIKSKLEEFRGDHERHVRDLSDEVRALGGEPEVKRDFKGFLIEGFTGILSQGDHTALLAMRGNEEITTRTYKGALDEELPESARAIVQKNYEDEQRHLSWIKNAIDTRAWERPAAPTKAA